MMFFKKLRASAVIFGVLVLALGFVVLNVSGTVSRTGCCWVLYCTLEPPIVCWEECRPCPEILQQTAPEPGKRVFGKQ
jgi:hypothetical protein